jgi:hypothetical protein
VRDASARLADLDPALGDLRDAGNIAAIECIDDGEFSVETVLAPRDA